ncbi:MAG: DUF721 domain-containing protein [Thermoleophilaceae bacterium]|nr:DUF721 domain-containing protein [Thermoleophilaceae bacterium]
MRRLAPRPLAHALSVAIGDVRPPTLLALVQAHWTEAAGPVLAASARPVSERDGVVTVACDSAVWAQELDLLQTELVGRLTELLGGEFGRGLDRLRFTVG